MLPLGISLYYFRIHLRHLLAPFPFWRPLIPLSVALLRCVSFTLARMKNSRRILAHSYLEIVSFVRCYPNSHLNHVIRTASFPSRLCFVPLARTSSTPRFTQFCQNEKSAMLDAMLYYFQIHLRHLLAPFPLCRPVVPFSVALLRCISLPLARTKNSRRILAHSHLEIVLV